MTNGLEAWGQAAKTHLQKVLWLQKRVLRLMYFSEPKAHAVPFFISLACASSETHNPQRVFRPGG